MSEVPLDLILERLYNDDAVLLRLDDDDFKVALLVFQWGIYKNRSFLHRLFIPFKPERPSSGNQLNLEFGRGSMSPF